MAETFLPIQPLASIPGHIFVLTGKSPGPTGQSAFQLSMIKQYPIEYQSIAEIEQAFLRACSRTTSSIKEARNIIARDSYRGSGNTILANSSFKDKLLLYKLSELEQMKIKISDSIDGVYVCYIGDSATDSAAIYAPFEDKHFGFVADYADKYIVRIGT